MERVWPLPPLLLTLQQNLDRDQMTTMNQSPAAAPLGAPLRDMWLPHLLPPPIHLSHAHLWPHPLQRMEMEQEKRMLMSPLRIEIGI